MVTRMASAQGTSAEPPPTWWLELRRRFWQYWTWPWIPVADAGLELAMLAFDIQLVLHEYHPLLGCTPIDVAGVGTAARLDEGQAVPVAAWLVVARAASVLGVVHHRLQVHVGEEPCR